MAEEVISTISPSTNKVIFERAGATIEDTRKIVDESNKAFQSWQHVVLSERKAIVVRALARIQERKAQLGDELTAQMGRPSAYNTKEIETMQKRADYLLDIVEDKLGDISCRPEAGFTRYIKKRAVGPVLIVFAWNVSIFTSMSDMIQSQNSLIGIC
jgi:acyl-CoA reductase-like NAD-dependent aldehyde dehydrogenase